jgi:hypothetical protein
LVPISAGAMAVGLLAACGGSGSASSRSVQTDEKAVRDRLDSIPKYPRSHLLQGSIPRAGYYVGSFSVTGTTPKRVVQFFVDELRTRGWDITKAPHNSAKTVRASWSMDRRTLQVSAAPAPTVERSQAAQHDGVQYSLMLRDGTLSDVPPSTSG